ncbi:MAG: dimethyl sulfoxide reductase anchor subunit [Coriobacteriaceae bacterium]|nr:dimethyl sulfoxide reductase anchor subunit [Coriobacteriaceae bacterium]
MDAALHELPLALFTTLASIGAGAFIVLAVAFFKTSFSEQKARAIDKATLIPTIVVLAGFVAAFFHLANPMNAMNVFAGIGRSPLSNELCVASLFAAVMVVFAVLAVAGKLSEGSRKGFLGVLAVLAVAFAAAMGMAYSLPTVPTWASPWPVCQMLGYGLLGGAALGACVLAFADALDDALSAGCKNIVLGVAGLGLVLAVLGLAMMVADANGIQTAIASGVELVGQATGCLVVAIIGLAAAFGLLFKALGEGDAKGAAIGAVAAALVGVLAGRFVFYILYLSVGIFF